MDAYISLTPGNLFRLGAPPSRTQAADSKFKKEIAAMRIRLVEDNSKLSKLLSASLAAASFETGIVTTAAGAADVL